MHGFFMHGFFNQGFFKGIRFTGLWTLLWLASGLCALAQVSEAPPEILRIGFLIPAERPAAEPHAALFNAVTRAARAGTEMAAEEFGFNAALLGRELEVIISEVADSAVTAEAERLVDEVGVVGLAGGFSAEAARALSAVAEARQVPFLNLAAPSDELRNEACSAYTFHIAPSAAMYMDALAGWFIRSEFRRWFFVYRDDEAGQRELERARWALETRHFGAREVGALAVPVNADGYTEALRAAERSRPDVVLMLLGPAEQLDFLAAYEVAGLSAAVTGFPDPVTQTRTFYAASRAAAPEAGSGFRATAWEATLDAYGARELNERYLARTGEPMDPAAWAAYQGVKIFFESASFAASRDGPGLAAYLAAPGTVLDAWKGIGLSFRPWDQQLRQPLYLVSIRAAQTLKDAALLVGELPAIYMPRTDPVERLDQLGDLERRSSCVL